MELLGSGNSLTLETALSDVPNVMGNASQLKEILLNLIFNSFDAMPEGGLVTLKTEMKIDIVQISITDNGIGMSREVLENCLTPFFTTKGKKGTGMGLAMTADIIEKHAGKLKVESTPGKGTEITILLPIHDADEIAGLDGEIVIEKSLNIFAVDNEIRTLEVIMAMLKSDGHAVKGFTDPREIINALQTETPDLVITDSFMPHISGFDLCQKVNRINPEIPIIILSGSHTKPFQVKLLEDAMIKTFIKKPVTISKLRKAIVTVFKTASK